MNVTSSLPSTLASGWQDVADFFVPARIASDREASNRARMFLISHLIGPILGNTVPIALFAFDPTPKADIAILAASICLFWVFPFLLRRGMAYRTLVLLSVINLNFCILLSCYHYGGVASPTLTWILIIPILSLFYVGGERQSHPQLLAVTAAAFAIFFLVYSLFPPEPNDIPAAAMLGLGAVSTVATLCYVATMAVYYARIFDAGIHLETEIRRRRLLADELRKAVVTAHRTGSAKAEFLARMSHEIRTPLNAIIGYGQILKEEALDTADRPFQEDIQRILDAANYLVRLINLILDLSKMEAGRMKFDIHPHDVGALLARAVADRRDMIEANGSQVAVEVQGGLETVDVDENRFLQIIESILENAAVHTHNGVISITAAEELSGKAPMFSVTISDSGPGISADNVATLFKTFATAENASSGRYGGTGLSLTVCGQLCRAMGGSISVESTLGEGSTFTVTLPIAPAGRPTRGVVDAQTLQAMSAA